MTLSDKLKQLLLEEVANRLSLEAQYVFGITTFAERVKFVQIRLENYKKLYNL